MNKLSSLTVYQVQLVRNGPGDDFSKEGPNQSFQKIICTFTIQSKLSLKFGNEEVFNAKMQHRCTACPTKLIDMST